MPSQQYKDPRNLFSVDATTGKITIETEPDLANDLVYALSVLLDLSRHIRAKVHHARFYAEANNQQDTKLRQNEFKKRSAEIFNKFQDHMNNGCDGDKAAALQCIKTDYQLGYGEAKIYVTEGRRLQREKKAALKLRGEANG